MEKQGSDRRDADTPSESLVCRKVVTRVQGYNRDQSIDRFTVKPASSMHVCRMSRKLSRTMTSEGKAIIFAESKSLSSARGVCM